MYNFKEFDMSETKYNNSIIMGKHSSGKTSVAKTILSQYRDDIYKFIISPTESIKNEYENMTKPIFIRKTYYDSNFVRKISEGQQCITKKYYYELFMNGKSDIKKNAILILDDCFCDNKCDRNIQKILFIGRTYSLSIVITMSQMLSIPPIMRTHIDYIFILKGIDISELKLLYKYFKLTTLHLSFGIFNEIIENLTSKNNSCMVINVNADSDNIEDKIFWHKIKY